MHGHGFTCVNVYVRPDFSRHQDPKQYVLPEINFFNFVDHITVVTCWRETDEWGIICFYSEKGYG